jgi:protein tyrosine/serine phosphatase
VIDNHYSGHLLLLLLLLSSRMCDHLTSIQPKQEQKEIAVIYVRTATRSTLTPTPLAYSFATTIVGYYLQHQRHIKDER